MTCITPSAELIQTAARLMHHPNPEVRALAAHTLDHAHRHRHAKRNTLLDTELWYRQPPGAHKLHNGLVGYLKAGGLL